MGRFFDVGLRKKGKFYGQGLFSESTSKMKISHIEIERFRQFQNFQLDLTYPAGHEKAGQALDKVCFIGQSGTGKTTLLELLYLIELKAEKEASPFQLHVSHPIRMKAETEWRAFSIAPRDAGSISFATSPIWMTTEMGPISQLSQSLAQDSWGIMYFPVAGSEKRQRIRIGFCLLQTIRIGIFTICC